MPDDPAYTGLHFRLVNDLPAMFATYSGRNASNDAAELVRRTNSEGRSFLTKTLPALGKALESALECGTFTPSMAFRHAKGSVLPKFLGPLWERVFDVQGTLLDTADASAVGAIRQVCYFSYKLDDTYPESVVDEVIKGFVETDRSLEGILEDFSSEQRRDIGVARTLLGLIFRDCIPGDIRPRPGPGACADGTGQWERYRPISYYKQVASHYSYQEYFYVGGLHFADRHADYLRIPVHDGGVSKMRLVPKDSRGPRVICMEPQEYMWLQQGLAQVMRDCLEQSSLSRGRVNFTNQNINRRHALESSVSRKYATLDMKEASDRVSRKLVRALFEGNTKMWPYLQALSTRYTELPNGDIIETLKFAPMGSSLCFPVMSAVHFGLAVACIANATHQSPKKIAEHVFVYGDDIVVPSQYAEILFNKFPLYGLMFNVQKSFVKGHFRESCGCDAFHGRDVTPVRLKKRFLANQEADCLMSALAAEGNLRSRGWIDAADNLRTLIASAFGLDESLPTVCPGSPIIGWRDPDNVSFGSYRRRFNKRTQVWERRCLVTKAKPTLSLVDGWEQLLRSQLVAERNSGSLDGQATDLTISWTWVDERLAYPRDTKLPRRIERLASTQV